MKNRESAWTHAAILLVLTFVVYANSLHGGFVFDDAGLVLQNPQISNVHTIGDVLHSAAGPRELLLFTYALNYLLGGVDSFGYHLVNVLLHACSVFLVYFIIRKLMDESPDAPRYALAGAAVFSVHTLLTGAVSYVSGRSSILCGLFYFGAVLCFLMASKRKWLYGLTAVLAFLAWETKQEAVTLPMVLAGLFWLRSEKRDWRVIAGLAVIPVIGIFLMRAQFQKLYESVTGNAGLMNAGFEAVLPAGEYFRTYITAVVGYILPRFLLPVSLCVDPYLRPVQHWFSPEFLFSVAVIAGIAFVFFRYGVKDRLLGAGILLLFVSPLFAYAVVPLADIVQEHRTYIPTLGTVVLFVWLFQRVHWAAPLAVVVLFGGLTVERNYVWNDAVSLWQDAVLKSPMKARTHFNLGASYHRAGRAADAIREYQLTLDIKPDVYAAYSNKAALLVDNGQFEEAEKDLIKVTEFAPRYTDGFINLGVLYFRQGKSEKAIGFLNHAVELDSTNFAAHLNRAEVLTSLNDFKGALEDYKTAVFLRPDMGALKIKLGGGYLRVGDRAAAEREYLALANTPEAADAFRLLGSMYSDAGDFDKAIEWMIRAVQARPNFPDAHQELAVMYIRKKDVDAAIREFRITLDQQPNHGPATLNLALAYEMKGDNASERGVLQNYLQRFGAGSPLGAQVQDRLNHLK